MTADREQTAQQINQTMRRLPLILEILDEIRDSDHPGDVDLHQGGMQAIRQMIGRLGAIQPAMTHNAPGESEQIAAEWLLGDQPARLIPPPLLEQLTIAIRRLLPPLPAYATANTTDTQ